MNYECLGCEFYNKPYWSIINPCANCSKRFKKVSGKTTHYTIHIDNKELYKEIENSQQENHQLKDRINQTINTIETTISIIKQQPSSDKELDLYFINQLERYLKLLKGDKE